MSAIRLPHSELLHTPIANEAAALQTLSRHVRSRRMARKLTRRELANASGVSERHLAQLELGSGNISVCLLSRVAAALGSSIAELFRDGADRSAELDRIQSLLQPLPDHQLERIRLQLAQELRGSRTQKTQRIALIGLRGAGKSTLGTRLSELYQVPFVELDREVEREAGTGLAEIFLQHGQAGYLQLERRALQRVLDEHLRAIIAAGGSIVTDSATYGILLATCFTVWVKASAEEHMARVAAQGDFRPMQDNAQAMQDLRRILELREPLYRQADLVIDTHGRTPEQSSRQLQKLLEQKA